MDSQKHVAHALRCLRMLPAPYVSEDANRITIAYFALATLEILGMLDSKVSEKERKDCIDWIYRQQLESGGFRGGPSVNNEKLEQTNILVNTFSAILCLALLNDDFSRLNVDTTVGLVARMQHPDGSFVSDHNVPETDLRHLYSAFAICYLLNNWKGVDIDLSIDYLHRCRTYEGGYAMSPGLEAHGGSTYCAIASFALASRLDEVEKQHQVIRYISNRQVPPHPSQIVSDDDDDDSDDDIETSDDNNQSKSIDLFTGGKIFGCAGFQGRTNKAPDACYSFWFGAALHILSPNPCYLSAKHDHQWLLSCQNTTIGGIAREPDMTPDIYHTYLSLAALSLGGLEKSRLGPVHPSINAPDSAVQRLFTIYNMS